MTTPPIFPPETFTLLGGRLLLADVPASCSARPAEDPLWLAALIPHDAPAGPVLDAGCGSGVLGLAAGIFQSSLCTQPLHLLDIAPAQCALAAHNANLNTRSAHTHTADITRPGIFTNQKFSLILSNPPFHQTMQGHRSSSARITQAHSASPHLLEAWLAGCLRLLAPGGQLHLVTHSASIALLRPLLNTCQVTEIPLSTHHTRAPKRSVLQVQANPGHEPVWKTCAPVPTWQPPLRQYVLQRAQSLVWTWPPPAGPR